MNSQGKVCALSGASGYVGSAIRRRLESEGWHVVFLSRRDAPDGDQIRWSLAAGPSIREELSRRNVSALVHAAWDMHLVDSNEIERVNVQGSVRLMEEAIAAGVARIVFVSTISAYEGARSKYGRSKLAVERFVLQHGGIVIRPGLVYGAGSGSGSSFGALGQSAGSHMVTPLVGDGSYPQYLVHADDLAEAVARSLTVQNPPTAPVTVAHPQKWPLRALLQELVSRKGKRTWFLPIPWPLVYGGLRVAEGMGLRLGFRSDSVMSLVRQNPSPEMNAGVLGVKPRPFEPQKLL